eukprot:m.303486 g.303486  ORF g.303486 m.303486 type:complete len:53 (+) comp20166_c0_seq1:170-328(+)
MLGSTSNTCNRVMVTAATDTPGIQQHPHGGNLRDCDGCASPNIANDTEQNMF